MSEPEPTPSSELLRLQRYGSAIAVVLLVAVASFFTGETLEIIFLRLMAVPLFIMSMIGISVMFSSEASRTPWTLYFLERKTLEGLGYAAFLTIIVWQPTSDIGTLIVTFLAALVVLGGSSMLFEAWQYRRRKGDGE